MVITESARTARGTRARPLAAPEEVRRILDDRDHFMPSFAAAFTAEDDASRARQREWQQLADPHGSGEHSAEWQTVRTAAADRLSASADELAASIARGVLARLRPEPRPTDREIVAPAVVSAVCSAFAPDAVEVDPAFVLGLTPAASDDEELSGTRDACLIAQGARDGTVVRLIVEAFADIVALLSNALPALAGAGLEHRDRAHVLEDLVRKHGPRAGTIRIVRADITVGGRTCAAGEEIWIDLRAARLQLRPGHRLDDRWDPLELASTALAERCLAQLVALVRDHDIRLVAPEPGEERGTFFWHELRGGTLARR